MKEMNLLETQLRSWELRRPSPGLRQRLFPAPAAKPELAWAIRWFAPATACVLLALCLFNQENGVPGASRTQPKIAVIASNQSPVAFEYTNRTGAGFLSSTGSTFRGRAN
jgi:hypothetical protein